MGTKFPSPPPKCIPRLGYEVITYSWLSKRRSIERIVHILLGVDNLSRSRSFCKVERRDICCRLRLQQKNHGFSSKCE